MTTFDFIKNCVDGKQLKPKTVSSVYFDGGIVYSYGQHYPLLIPFKKNDVTYWIVNDRGYSVTTARHIHHAKQATNGFQYCVNLQKFNKYDIKESLLNSATLELKDIKEKLATLSTRAYKQRETLITRQILVQRTISLVS